MNGETWNAFANCHWREPPSGYGQHVRMALLPGRVGDLRDEGLDASIGGVEHVIEADRVEAMAEVAQMGQHPDRARRSLAGCLPNPFAHRFVERHAGIAEVIRASHPRERGPPCRPQPEPVEHMLELGEVQIHHEQPVPERMRPRLAPVVRDDAFVKAALHFSQARARAMRAPTGAGVSCANRVAAQCSSWSAAR